MPMAVKRSISKKKTRDLFVSAEDALAEGITRVGQFTDSGEFHRSLVQALGRHRAFKNAVRDFHARSVSGNGSAKGQAPRQVVPSGRVQAPRHDSPKGWA